MTPAEREARVHQVRAWRQRDDAPGPRPLTPSEMVEAQRGTVCACGLDYMAVPIDHVCSRPRPARA